VPLFEVKTQQASLRSFTVSIFKKVDQDYFKFCEILPTPRVLESTFEFQIFLNLFFSEVYTPGF